MTETFQKTTQLVEHAKQEEFKAWIIDSQYADAVGMEASNQLA